MRSGCLIDLAGAHRSPRPLLLPRRTVPQIWPKPPKKAREPVAFQGKLPYKRPVQSRPARRGLVFCVLAQTVFDNRGHAVSALNAPTKEYPF
ncbi:hypothetical protein Q669_12140 [Labrenzia sp. C1B10]|nr:hypothetical protein Q669_12140 [Labrenzia sp. C1B10]ERS07813.1 hypothetical protein Q675_20770 [Labrenzia sp. C1B70]